MPTTPPTNSRMTLFLEQPIAVVDLLAVVIKVALRGFIAADGKKGFRMAGFYQAAGGAMFFEAPKGD